MLVTSVIALIGLLVYLGLSKRSSNTPTQKAVTPGSVPDIIINTLTAAGYSREMAKAWVRVSKMETAGWASQLFRALNNLWGMKVSQVRNSTQINFGSSDTWAAYSSVTDSARDMVYYLQARKYPLDVEGIDQLVAIMYQKQYFVGESYESYLNKVLAWS